MFQNSVNIKYKELNIYTKSSTSRQKGLSTSYLYSQLDPFALKLTKYTGTVSPTYFPVNQSTLQGQQPNKMYITVSLITRATIPISCDFVGINISSAMDHMHPSLSIYEAYRKWKKCLRECAVHFRAAL